MASSLQWRIHVSNHVFYKDISKYRVSGVLLANDKLRNNNIVLNRKQCSKMT